MANRIKAHTNIGYCRAEIRSAVRDLKTAVDALAATNLLTKASPQIRAQAEGVRNRVKGAETELVKAELCANALAGVRKIPKADTASYKITCGSGNVIVLNPEGTDVLLTRIRLNAERLSRVSGRIKESCDELAGIKITDQLISSLDVIDALFPVLGTLAKGAAIAKIISDGKEQLRNARMHVDALTEYFNELAERLKAVKTAVAGAEAAAKKDFWGDLLMKTALITKDHKPKDSEIRARVEELEKRQADYIAVYGTASPEIAAEIARLKKLYEYKAIMDQARKDKLGHGGQEFKDWFYNHYGGLDPKRSFGWCDRFSSWMVGQFGKKLPSGGCSAQLKYFKKYGGAHTEAGYAPKTGDVVFFDWGKNGSIDHVGVIYVDEKTGELYVLHGNFSGKVCYNKLSDVLKWNNGKVAGYGDTEKLPNL